jgi:hypothetical protein
MKASWFTQGTFPGRNLRKLTACDRNGVGVDFEKRSTKIGGIEHDVIYVLFAAG